GPAAIAGGRGETVRRFFASPPLERQARPDLPLAGERTQQRSRFRGMGAAGFGVHRQLVALAGHENPLANRAGGSSGCGRKVKAVLPRLRKSSSSLEFENEKFP